MTTERTMTPICPPWCNKDHPPLLRYTPATEEEYEKDSVSDLICHTFEFEGLSQGLSVELVSTEAMTLDDDRYSYPPELLIEIRHNSYTLDDLTRFIKELRKVNKQARTLMKGAKSW